MLDKTYEFDNFRLDLSQKTLRKNGEIVAIQPKVFDVLAVLVIRNNEIVSREDLLNEVWGDTFVEETNVRLCIHSLRKILDGKYIETVSKRGYRFTAKLTDIDTNLTNKKPLPVSNSEAKILAKRSTVLAKYIVAAILLISLVSAAFIWKSYSKRSQKLTISVLPFTQVGKKVDKNLGVTVAVIVQLSKLKDYQILPIDASATNADALLNGTFRNENGIVKVTANLQNSATKETIWNENFDIKPDKELGLESSIAARLVRLFSTKMVEYDDEINAKSQNINPEALNAYLSARKIWRSRNLGRVEEMNSLLQKSIDLEPNWAVAHAARAEALLMDDFVPTNYTQAEKLANETLAIDGKQVGALTVLGQVAVNRDWDFEKAESFYKQAIAINPNYASTYNAYGNLLAIKRNFVESEKLLKKALEIEPFSPLYNTSLCQTYFFDNRADEALKQCKYAMQLEPNFWVAQKNLFWIYVHKGMNKDVAEMVLGKYSEEAKAKLPYAKTMQEGNLEDYWKDYFANSKSSESKNHYTDSMMYLQLNQKDKALESLEKATVGREWLSFRLNSDPIFDSIRAELRFLKMLQKLNIKP